MGTETEASPHQPLLLSGKQDVNVLKKYTSALLKSTKWVLKLAMWLVFTAWVSFLFLVPVDGLFKTFADATSGGPGLFGMTGSFFLIYSGPVLVIAFLAIIYLRISGEEEIQENKKKGTSFRLWTFPIIVDGALGVVTATTTKMTY